MACRAGGFLARTLETGNVPSPGIQGSHHSSKPQLGTAASGCQHRVFRDGWPCLAGPSSRSHTCGRLCLLTLGRVLESAATCHSDNHIAWHGLGEGTMGTDDWVRVSCLCRSELVRESLRNLSRKLIKVMFPKPLARGLFSGQLERLV